MKRVIFYFVLFCLTISFSFANNSALDYYNAGRNFQQRENFARAIEYYQESLLINTCKLRQLNLPYAVKTIVKQLSTGVNLLVRGSRY